MIIPFKKKLTQPLYKWVAYLVTSGIVAGFTMCRNSAPPAEEAVSNKTPVTVASPEFKTVSEILEFPAVSSFIRKNVIRSSTTGTVEATSVTPGDIVKKGQLLFSVKTLEATALQRSSKTDTGLVFKGLIKIISPEDGVVSTISHQNGDFIQEGDELAVVSDLSSIVFILEVPFEMTRYIERNKICPLILPDSSTITGRIRDRLPEMNIQNQTVSYIVEPQTSRNFPQNLIATARIAKSIKTGAQVLPKPAVLGNETQTEFWVMILINDSTAVKIPVTKGIENNSEVEITSPKFLPSDKILISGNYGLPDTALVVVNN